MEVVMIKKISFCLGLLFIIQISSAAENEYGIVQAWLNDKPATVEGINLKVGEPVEVKVTVTSKIDGNVYLMLKEPGVTRSYNVKNGPSEFEGWIENRGISSGWEKIYNWTLVPNGAWTDGNAPINVVVQFHKADTRGSTSDKFIRFSVANPYILNEQFSGAPLEPTPSIPPASTPSSSPKNTPGFGLLLAIFALVGAGLLARRR